MLQMTFEVSKFSRMYRAIHILVASILKFGLTKNALQNTFIFQVLEAKLFKIFHICHIS